MSTVSGVVRSRSDGEAEQAGDPGESTNARPAKVRRSGRACDACAKVKMRCDAGSDNASPCHRCSRQGYDCTYHNAAARQRRKSKQPSSATDQTRSSRRSTSAHAHVVEQQQQQHQQPQSAPELSHFFEGLHGGVFPSAKLDGHGQLPPNFSSLPLSTAPLPTTSDSASTSLSWLSAPNELPTLDLNAAGNSNESDMGMGAGRTQALASTPTYEQSTQSDASPGSLGGFRSTTNPGSTPGKSSSSKNKGLRQLVNPLGLLVFASLDIPESALPINEAGSGQSGQGTMPPPNARLADATTLAAPPGDSQLLTATTQDIYFRSAGVGRSKITADRSFQQPAACHILSQEQIHELFNIFYKHFHGTASPLSSVLLLKPSWLSTVHAPLIDLEYGKPEQIASRSHFLFHTICAIAMRGWSGPSDKQEKLLRIMLSHLKLLPNERTLGCVQANLLCATWNPVSPQHVDLDEQYIRVGLAVRYVLPYFEQKLAFAAVAERLAMDLRLHLTDTEQHTDTPAWILYEQRRTWALCYVFESKISAHRHQECYIPSTGLACLDKSPDDKRMLSSVEWCRIVSRINKQHPDGFSREHSIDPSAEETQSRDELSQCDAIENDLLHWKDYWIETFSTFPHNLQVLVSRTRLYYHYAQLLNYAHAVQSLSGKPDWADSAYAAKYLDAVVRMLYTFVEDFGVHRTATYLSDLHFTCTAFSAVSLIHSLTLGIAGQSYQAASSVRLLKRVADVFEASSGDYGHNLRNQARYLRAVLTAKLDDQGKPRNQSQQLNNETDWNMFNFNDFLYEPPTRPPTRPSDRVSGTSENGQPVDHGLIGLDAFLNSELDFGMAQNTFAYWDSILGSAQDTHYDASRYMAM